MDQAQTEAINDYRRALTCVLVYSAEGEKNADLRRAIQDKHYEAQLEVERHPGLDRSAEYRTAVLGAENDAKQLSAHRLRAA
jgi:hypothetical protein